MARSKGNEASSAKIVSFCPLLQCFFLPRIASLFMVGVTFGLVTFVARDFRCTLFSGSIWGNLMFSTDHHLRTLGLSAPVQGVVHLWNESVVFGALWFFEIWGYIRTEANLKLKQHHNSHPWQHGSHLFLSRFTWRMGFLTFGFLFCVVLCCAVRLMMYGFGDDPDVGFANLSNCVVLCRYGVWEQFQISLQAEVVLALFPIE